MLLYWGARRRTDCYMMELAERWQHEHANFKFIPVLSDAQPEDNWHGRTGFVHEATLADIPDLARYEVYVCGSVRMVETAFSEFLARGLTEESCFSDAFMPSSR
jgi:NAD(P)H-flavin reductase